MILFKISRDKRFASIGVTEQEAEWYTIEPHVEKFVYSIPLGAEVGIKSEKKDNKNHLVFITSKTAGGPTTEPVHNTVSTPPPTQIKPQIPVVSKPTSFVSSGNKTPEVQESIKRQAIGKMVAESLVALQGQLTPATIKEVITDLYAHYQSLVG